VNAHVDEDRVLKLGVPIQDVYGTLQALLGGSFGNQFNRFGRPLAGVRVGAWDRRAFPTHNRTF